MPFVLCLLGLGMLLTASRWRGRAALLAFRGTMAALALGTLAGAYFHAVGNLEFVLETQPNVDLGRLVVEVLTGRDPLLAPGVLVVIAALALASAYATDGESAVEGPSRGSDRTAPIRLRR